MSRDDEDEDDIQSGSGWRSVVPSAYAQTDLGNADFFVDLFGSILRFDQSRKRWLMWKSHRWEPDMLKRAEEAAQVAARHRLMAATRLPSGGIDPATGRPDAAELARIEAIKWAVKSESRFAIESVLSLAQKNSKLSVTTVNGWDSDPWTLGVPNGVINLRTGDKRPGDKDDRITLQAGIAYDPKAACPRWERFLFEVFDGDDELVTFFRRGVGYTLTGDLREDCWFGCYGSGRNGKSTLFRVLHQIFGDYRYVAPFSLVERGHGESKRDFDIAYLQNMRFVMASETREGGVWDEERLKRLSGGDPLHAEIKHGAEFEFLPTHKLWFMFNHQPRVRDHSIGFWRRVRMLPFNRKFEGVEDDQLLDKKLERELPGILNWAVQACMEWQREGLRAPRAVLLASTKYESDEDPLTEFCAKHLQSQGPGFTLSSAFALYKQYAKREHIDHPLGKNRFAALLEPRGFRRSSRRDVAMFDNGKLVYMCTCMQNPCTCLRP